jgi:ferredoxin
MQKNIVVSVSGKNITADPEQRTLLNCLLTNGIEIRANCEGNGACGKCHVYLDQEHYDRLRTSDSELDTLEKQMNLKKTSRLACQLEISPELDGAAVEIAD